MSDPQRVGGVQQLFAFGLCHENETNTISMESIIVYARLHTLDGPCNMGLNKFLGVVVMKRVFLGGTCNSSRWRNQMMIYLRDAKIDYFNPVVDDWNDSAQAMEIKEREMCDFCLYTITPKMTGVYAIAEAVDDSNKRPKKTIFIIIKYDGMEVFDDRQLRSLNMVAKMVKRNGGQVFDNLKSAAVYLGKRG